MMTSSKHRQKLFWLLLFLLILCACRKEKTFSPTPYEVVIPRYFPTELNIPEDNPMTVEGVELGRKLFYDNKLRGYSGSNPDSMMCCATCHVPDAGFDLGTDNPRLCNGKPLGINGTPTHHNALPIVNLIFNHEGYGWNGGMKSIEEIVGATITDPTEFGSSHARVVATLSADAEYREMFRKAFGTEEVTLDRIEKAVAQYVRTLIDGDSKFDGYLRGEEHLTEQEWRGYVLFTTEEGADCFHCHGNAGTPLFTTNRFYNNALDATFSDPLDRFSVTGNPIDHGAYRAPTLRNISLSAPYMHDGRFSTLDEVLEFYNIGLQNSPYVSPLMHKINDGGACLTPSQIADLKAFLETL